ncbi:hypothetical protein ACVWW1_007821 [Bradyrhizobium sp. JR3.5]
MPESGTRPEPLHRCVDAPGQRRFLGDAEIDADLLDGRDVAILRQAVGAQHATEMGHGADDEADARATAAFQDADLNALARLLGVGANDCGQRGDGGTGKESEATHVGESPAEGHDASREQNGAVSAAPFASYATTSIVQPEFAVPGHQLLQDVALMLAPRALQKLSRNRQQTTDGKKRGPLSRASLIEHRPA